MPNAIPVSDWLEFMDREYLSTFIQEGGATIKFAVPVEEEVKHGLRRALRDLSARLDYIYVKIDSAETRVHLPQELFFAMAGQVDWRLMARRLVLGLSRDLGHLVDTVNPYDSSHIYRAIGEANGLSSEMILRELRPELESKVYKNPQMAKDFRVAMLHLCLQEGTEGDQEYGGQPLIDWLTGNNTRVSNVRPFLIYNTINRTTARHFLESAFYWFKYVGYTGTVILLDNRRVTLARNPRDGFRYYNRAMAIDHYELLREFIDSTDRLIGTLLVVVTNNEFLNSEGSGRGFGIYQALMTRVMDDVRDRALVNPVASLIRLA